MYLPVVGIGVSGPGAGIILKYAQVMGRHCIDHDGGALVGMRTSSHRLSGNCDSPRSVPDNHGRIRANDQNRPFEGMPRREMPRGRPGFAAGQRVGTSILRTGTRGVMLGRHVTGRHPLRLPEHGNANGLAHRCGSDWHGHERRGIAGQDIELYTHKRQTVGRSVPDHHHGKPLARCPRPAAGLNPKSPVWRQNAESDLAESLFNQPPDVVHGFR